MTFVLFWNYFLSSTSTAQFLVCLLLLVHSIPNASMYKFLVYKLWLPTSFGYPHSESYRYECVSECPTECSLYFTLVRSARTRQNCFLNSNKIFMYVPNIEASGWMWSRERERERKGKKSYSTNCRFWSTNRNRFRYLFIIIARFK